MDTSIQIAKRRTMLEIRREQLKAPGVMQALAPVERAVFIAATSKVVGEYESAELTMELAQALKWICKDVGYRASDAGEMQYLVIRIAEILKRYYPSFTLKDFRMAFEMSLTGELDEFLPKDRNGQPDKNHYQQFNAEYICKILNAYKGRRNRVLKRVDDLAPEREMEMPIPPEVSRRYRNQNRADAVKAFIWYKYHGRLQPLNSIAEKLIYDVLYRLGLADAIEVPENEQKMLVNERVRELTQQGRKDEAERIKGNADEVQFAAFLRCRRKAIKAAFDWLMDEDLQLINYISYECEN